MNLNFLEPSGHLWPVLGLIYLLVAAAAVVVVVIIVVRPLGRPRRRWEHKIKMDLQEVGRGGGAGHGLDLSWLRIGTGGGRL